MNLQVPDELISAYFDGEVTPDERAEVERWLATSTELRLQLDETSKLSALLHSFPRESAPGDLTANVQKRVEAAPLPTSVPFPASLQRSWRRDWIAFGAGILATMASLLAMVTLNQPPLAQKPDQLEVFHQAKLSETPVMQAEQESLGRFAHVAARDGIPLGVEDRSRTHGRLQPPDEEVAKLSESADSTEMPFFDETLTRSKSKSNLADGDAAMDNGQDRQPANRYAVVTNLFGTANSVQPQTQNEFLWSLANGDVVVSRIADPSNTVAVVDLTVVDIDRGAEELKILLQKRLVRQVDENDGSPAKNRVDSKLTVAEKKLTGDADAKETGGSDEFQVFYVLAPGDQLASTIDDLIKNHPDLYRNWTPQPPIELPVPASASTKAIASTQDARGASPAADKSNEDQRDAAEKPQAVNAEADMAVNFLVARNTQMNTNVDQNYSYQGNSVGGNATAFDVGTSLNRKAEAAAPAAGVFAEKRQAGEPLSSGQAAAKAESYFRVSRENSPHLGLQLATPVQNSALPTLTKRMQDLNMDNVPKNRRQALANNDDRSSKLVRMLIVLKSEQPAASISPSP